MAEAIVNARLGENWQAYSAGTKPAGYIHPMALTALAEAGITHAGRSKNVAEFAGMAFDLVVTVCDSAAEECPLWLGKEKRIHYSFIDPAKNEDMEEFRAVCSAIGRKIPALLSRFE